MIKPYIQKLTTAYLADGLVKRVVFSPPERNKTFIIDHIMAWCVLGTSYGIEIGVYNGVSDIPLINQQPVSTTNSINLAGPIYLTAGYHVYAELIQADVATDLVLSVFGHYESLD